MAVTDDAITSIRDMIVDGRLGPGSRLPAENELSAELGLSRSSLREAVKALELIRVLDVRRGDGTYVTSLEPRLLLEAMSFVVDLHRDDSILEVFAVRRLLEPQVAALAAKTVSDEQLATLDQVVASIAGDADVEELVMHDVEFHHQIAEATGNSYLTTLLDSLSGNTIRARVWRGITEANSVARTIDEHRAILGALRLHDENLAQALMLAHVSGVEQWLNRAR
jgi:GntR family transcriptional regulator, transcriptional repressor for pyruvate dehydrogenase complex